MEKIIKTDEPLPFYKCKILTRMIPTDKIQCYPLQTGDTLYINTVDKDTKIGQKLYNDEFIVSEVFYKPRKWYEFFKKKEIIGANIIKI